MPDVRYEKTGHVPSALFYYESVQKQWPETIAATKAQQRLAMLAPERLGTPGDNTVTPKENSPSPPTAKP